MIAKLSTKARLTVLLALALLAGCKAYAPVKHSEIDWSPEMAQLATADIDHDIVTLHNMRHCTYRTAKDFDVEWHDKTVNLSKIRTVDFVMTPFGDVPGIAHTFLSYGFEGDDYVSISVETRRKRGESYNPFLGLTQYYPLIYIVADERDTIVRRAVHDMNDVYVYRANATPEQAREMFVDMIKRANKLTKKPEYYNTLTNNCTSNIARHVNRVAHYDKVPISSKLLFPGYSDQIAYQLGLIASDKPFAETKREARVNEKAYIYRDDPNFSRLIRR
jgi:hypothetical protein